MLKARFFEALDRENGSVVGAAKAVGVNRHTVASWARRAGVRGRGKPGGDGHPGRAGYERLRAAGVRRRDATAIAGVHERTARDWDQGIRQIGHSRLRGSRHRQARRPRPCPAEEVTRKYGGGRAPFELWRATNGAVGPNSITLAVVRAVAHRPPVPAPMRQAPAAHPVHLQKPPARQDRL